jgi:hypothetical protein
VHEDGGALSLWDRDADERIHQVEVPDLSQVEAVPTGCLTLAGGVVALHGREGESRELAREATAMSVTPETILVAADRHVIVHDHDGGELGRHEAGLQVSAVAHVGDRLAVGHEDGTVSLRPLAPGEEGGDSLSLSAMPSSVVVRILEGPPGVVVVAHASGHLGLWTLEDGSMIHETYLHGPALHLLLSGERLFAASELGDVAVLDVGIFLRDRCEVLREVWEEVPVTWEAGRAVVAPRPGGHDCSPVRGGESGE